MENKKDGISIIKGFLTFFNYYLMYFKCSIKKFICYA